jgi:hypothetical protein
MYVFSFHGTSIIFNFELGTQEIRGRLFWYLQFVLLDAATATSGSTPTAASYLPGAPSKCQFARNQLTEQENWSLKRSTDIIFSIKRSEPAPSVRTG